MFPLKDKVVILTGASQGIGAKLAALLLLKGAKLSLAARDETLLRQVAGSSDSLVCSGDLTEASTRTCVIEQTLQRWGRIDVLINNAGRGSYYSLAESSESETRAVFDLNFFAPLALTQLAIPHLEKTRGSLVNVSSMAGQINLPWMSVYSASKSALSSLTAGERVEFRRRGIHVMGVFPGYIDTEFQSHAPGPRPPSQVARARRFAVSAEVCATAIVRGLELQKTSVVTPSWGWLLVWGNRLMPGIVEKRLGSLQ